MGCQRDGGCVVGEVLKLLLLKEKEQMVLDPGGDGRSQPCPAPLGFPQEL